MRRRALADLHECPGVERRPLEDVNAERGGQDGRAGLDGRASGTVESERNDAVAERLDARAP